MKSEIKYICQDPETILNVGISSVVNHQGSRGTLTSRIALSYNLRGVVSIDRNANILTRKLNVSENRLTEPEDISSPESSFRSRDHSRHHLSIAKKCAMKKVI